jgi:hypothetical protein
LYLIITAPAATTSPADREAAVLKEMSLWRKISWKSSYGRLRKVGGWCRHLPYLFFMFYQPQQRQPPVLSFK